MNRNIIGTAIMAAVGSAAVVAAQAPQSSTPQTAPPARVTIIGCLQPSDASTTGTSKASDTKYVLKHAKRGKSDSKNPTGSTGKSSESPTASTYRLDAEDATLSPEVGHQVEIVAVIEEPDSTTSTGTAGTAGATGASTDAPKLKVETVKMIAMACPE